METQRKAGPKTTAEIAAKQRGVLRRGDNHILRDENDVPIDGYRPPTQAQDDELDAYWLHAPPGCVGFIPAMPNNVAAADLIRRLRRRAF